MRILAIRGRNLASLAGDFELDLERPPLQGEGLFAISGPTGSGKSTLLDALCLALYGRVPRLPDRRGVSMEGEAISNIDARNILRRGAGEGFAEVDFIGVDGGRYRSRWQVRRAHGRPGGRLQEYEVSLKALDGGRVLAAKKMEHRQRIEELVGLSFDQFRRSVLLAQGDFAAFLESGPENRAELLERMTGTEIYSELSRLAHEREREEKARLEQLRQGLGGIELLPEAQRRQTEEEAGALQDELRTMKRRLEALQNILRWYREWQKLAERLDGARKEGERLNALEPQVQPLRRTLEELQRVEPLRADWQRLRELVGTIGVETRTLETLEERIREKQVALEQARETEKAAEATLRQARVARDSSGPQLNQARELDLQIQAAKDQVEEHRRRLDKARDELETLGARQSELEAARKRHQEKLQRAKAWVNEHRFLRLLAEQWPRWEGLLSRMARSLKEVVEAQSGLKELEEKEAGLQQAEVHRSRQLAEHQARVEALERELRELQQQLERLPAHEVLQAERNELEQAEYFLLEAEGLRKSREESRHQEHEILGEMETLTVSLRDAGEALEQANTELAGVQGRVAEARHALDRLSLRSSEVAEQLRMQLEPGQPCPVCGSETHPWAGQVAESLRQDRDAQQQRLEALQAREQALGTQVAELKAALAADKRNREALSAKCEEQRRQQEELRIRWRKGGFSERMGLPLEDDGLPARLSELREPLGARLEELGKMQDDLARLQKRLGDRHGSLEEARRAGDELQEQEKKEAEARAELRQRRAELQSILDHAGSTLEEARFELRDPMAHHPDWERELLEKGGGLVRELAAEAREWTQWHLVVQTAEQALGDLAPDAARLETSLKQQRQKESQLQQALKEARKEREELEQQRGELFQGRPVAEVEQQLSRDMEQAESRHREVGQVRADLEKGLESLRGEQRTLAGNLERNLGQRSQVEESLNQGLAPIGMDLERMEALLSMERREREELAESVRAHDRKIHENRTVVQERKEQLEAHEQARPEAAETEAVAEHSRIEEQRERLRARYEELRLALARDDENRQRIGELQRELERQEASWKAWAEISEVIGSANGGKFRTFAQSLTLEVLVMHANRHLQQLSKRYRLERVPGSQMELQVVDADLGDEVRSIYGLSGGEKFLVSLALALGMASLSAHRVRVESLFIDEGFGTLDAETLDMAIEALDALQAQGRQVGVISHVSALTEGVRVRVLVRPHGGGRSTLEVHAA